MKITHRFLSFVLIPLLLVGLFLPVPDSAAQAAASPTLDAFSLSARQVLAGLPAGQKSGFIITLRDQLASSPAAAGGISPLQAAAAAQPTRAARQKVVIESLQAQAAQQQAGLLAAANTLQAQGQVDHVTPFWIFNGISLQATPAAILALAARPEVARITPDPDPNARIVLLDDHPANAPTGQAALQKRWTVELPPMLGPASTPLPEPNVALVNAPALWNMGYTGQGVVVASLDTGVDVTHPDLAASYRGGTNSWYDPYNENPTPADFFSDHHGTMTMSLIVGGSAGGSSIGMAPGAKWISAKIFDNAGDATVTAIHLAFQWVLNPNNDSANPGAPDVVNNSWGYTSTTCDISFQPDLQALVAAGIVPVFSAGNSGPNPSSDIGPANNAGAFAVGAIDNNSVIASLSSRGPNSCNAATPFPNLVAPGVTLKAAIPGGLYSTCTGTSCAAPEVTGGIALLLSALPHLGLNLREQSLMQSAVDLGPAGYDPSYGYGRLDVLKAYNWLTATQHLLVVPGGLTATAVSPGQINLSWHDNNHANATGYEVERSPNGAPWTPLSTTVSGATSFDDGPGLAEGTTCNYQVRAVNTNITPATYSQFATVQATTPLQAPTGLSATAVSASQINLHWTNNTSLATQIVLQRSPDGASGWTTINTIAANLTTYSDTTGLAESSPYFYRVQAANVNAASVMVGGASAITPLQTPTLSAAAISSTQINLSWVNHSAHATGFEVQHSPSGLNGWTTLATLLVDVTSYQDTPLTPGVVYHYRVRALGAGADSDYTAPAAVYLPPFQIYFPLIGH